MDCGNPSGSDVGVSVVKHPSKKKTHHPSQDGCEDSYVFCEEGDEESSGSESDTSDLDTVCRSAQMFGRESDDSAHSDSSSLSDSDTSIDHDNVDDSDPLYPGASLSVSETVLKIIGLYVQHKWTQKCLKDTLEVFHQALPESSELPSSVYKMFAYIEGFSTVPSATQYWYCSNPDCFKPKNCDEKCSSCGSEDSSKFFHFSLTDQVKYLFEHRNLAQAIDSFKSTQTSESNHICDVRDGSEYVKIKSDLTGQYDLVFLWNTDGVSLSGSSNVQVYPIFCVPCEVSPSLRNSFLIVAGIWCDVRKPPMNMYLKPFVTALQDIQEGGGVEWVHPVTGRKHSSKVAAPALSADAPATADVLNVQYFSAIFGCNTCEQARAAVKPAGEAGENQEEQRRGRKEPAGEGSGEAKKPGRMKTGKKQKKETKLLRRFVHQDEEALLRSGPKMDEQGVEAEETGKPVQGVRGRAIVSSIPFFDRGKAATAEYMHSVLLGVVKYFTLLWCFTSGPWFIGNSLKEIDQLLKSTTVPNYINRPPRGISKEILFWKASEYRSWLLFYSLPALNGILRDDYFDHWILLVSAIFLLLKETISDDDLRCASVLLRMFVRGIKHLYGLQYYSYNVHQLLHLPLFVTRWGPLWATSTFPFESYNAVLSGLIHGTKNKGQELINQIKLAQGVVCLKNYVERSKSNASQKSGGISCLGGQLTVDLSPDHCAAITKAGLSSCVFYGRAICDLEKYSSALYDKKKKVVNSYVKFFNLDQPNSAYAQIHFFVKSLGKVYVLLKLYDIDHSKFFFHKKTSFRVPHIVPCEESGSLLVLPIQQISCKTIKVGSYFCIRPNTVECNL